MAQRSRICLHCRGGGRQIPGLRSPGGGYGNSLQYSCLDNPMNRGGWGAKVGGVAKPDTTEAAEQKHICSL